MNDNRPHLLHVFPAFGGGGPEVRTSDIINQSVDRFRHTIFSLSGELTGRERLSDADCIKCLPVNRSSLWALSRSIRSQRPDLLLTYGWGGTDAIVAARLTGIRRIVHTEDGFLDDEVERQNWKRRWARRLVFQAARSMVVPSLSLCAIARNSWRIPNSRLRYIPNGIDIDRFTPATAEQRISARRQHHFPDDAIVIGIVGALRPEKNQLRLLQAFAELSSSQPQARLLIVGDGPLMSQLQQAAHDVVDAKRVVFAGAVRDTSKIYHAMDVLALSSDTEQMPLSVLEGMASGLPVVSTDVGDVRHMLDEQNRPLVTPRESPTAFARAISSLLDDSNLRERLGKANRSKCTREFGWRDMMRSYLDVYEEFATAS